MSNNEWLKQNKKPLFESLEWNKPERRDQTGKLLIIGGDMHNLGAPASAFNTVKQTGIGSVKIALPDKTKKLIIQGDSLQQGDSLMDTVFLPSTNTGEFSKDGEDELLNYASWADSILIPGDIGRNSQTAILLQNILAAYKERVILTRDALDLLSNAPSELLKRPRTTLVASFAQLQKLAKNYGETTPLVFSMDLVKLVEYLQNFTAKTEADIVTLHLNQLIVTSNGKVSTTKLDNSGQITDIRELQWRLNTASIAACYQTWYPQQSFEALRHTAYLVK